MADANPINETETVAPKATPKAATKASAKAKAAPVSGPGSTTELPGGTVREDY